MSKLYFLIENPSNSDLQVDNFSIEIVHFNREYHQTLLTINVFFIFLLTLVLVVTINNDYYFNKDQEKERNNLVIPINDNNIILPEKLIEFLNILWIPMQENNISLKESEILLSLKSKNNNSASIKDIKHDMDLDSQIITYRTQTLEKKGLIFKVRNLEDTRLVLCQLSDMGIKFTEQLNTAINNLIEKIK